MKLARCGWLTSTGLVEIRDGESLSIQALLTRHELEVRSPRQPRPEPAKVFTPTLVVRHDPPERLPVVPSVPTMPQMDEFVDDDVIDEPHRRLDNPPVQPDSATVVAAPPPLPLVGDDDLRHRHSRLRLPHVHPFRESLGGMTGRSHMVNATTPLVSQMVSSSQEFVEAGH